MQSILKSVLPYLALSGLVFSCSDAARETETKPLNSGILMQNMDTTVRPGDDFMSYVNGSWIENTEIPADKPSYGVAYMVYEKSEDDVRAIIEKSADGEFAKGSDEQKVGDLYKSYMDMETRNSLGATPMKDELDKVDAIDSYEALASYFAYATKLGISNPLDISIFPDVKNPEAYAAYLSQSGLGLPDREYYLQQDERSKALQEQYVAHIEKMLTLADLPGAAEASGRIMALETRIAEKHLEKEKTRDLKALYNMVSADSLAYIMPAYNWDGFLAEAGLAGQGQLVLLMLDYIKALDGIITTTPLDTWKDYLRWGVISNSASRLDQTFDDANFAFYGTILSGVPEPRPLWRRAVGRVNGSLGEVVGKVYVKEHFTPEAKDRMETLVQNLLKAYEVSIQDLEWMGPETKQEALDKLNKFTPKIGYPDEWKAYDLAVKPDDLFGNLKRSSLLEYNREVAKLGQPIDKGEWGMNPQMVNAYYNPTMNEIVFPAAILQPPFFDMTADDAVNYGAIGSIIGHEIGHGFDDKGSTFDGTGALRNWWTDEDRAEFEKRTAQLVEQYNGYEVLPDLYVNGEFTLGENIGDLGGLVIALKAYQMSLNGKEAPVLDGYTGLQRFFIGYGQAWLNKARDEALRRQINTDPHAPARFRANGVVRNMPEFYEAFDVEPSDSLYLAPDEQVKIW